MLRNQVLYVICNW